MIYAMHYLRGYYLRQNHFFHSLTSAILAVNLAHDHHKEALPYHNYPHNGTGGVPRLAQ